MTIAVEVVYALSHAQTVIKVLLDEGACVEEAIAASGILAMHPEINAGSQRIGIWGRVATADTRLRDGDRLEIYRDLTVDPKQLRRRKAQAQRSVKPRR